MKNLLCAPPPQDLLLWNSTVLGFGLVGTSVPNKIIAFFKFEGNGAVNIVCHSFWLILFVVELIVYLKVVFGSKSQFIGTHK